ncbi:MAG: hypothetical protein M3Y77_19255 [Actinomycetota bacterium]|nr:hypothetical protein [Actinomycetota bacterium]
MMVEVGQAPALERRVPPLGGFNATVIRLEIRRLLCNRRTLLLTMIIPTVFYLLFGLNPANGTGSASASLLISMALYGAVLATSSGGAMVSIERAAGWSRQLRITPLVPAAYIAVKIVTSLVLGAAAVVVVHPADAVLPGATHHRRLHPDVGTQRPGALPRHRRRLRLDLVANLTGWLAIFSAGVAVRFSKDTARV